MINLKIGVAKNSLDEISALRQEGVPFFETSGDKKINDRTAGSGSVIKEFITSAGMVREKVALFPGKDMRQEFSRNIAESFYKRGLPFIRIWYYPRSYRSVFNFRFDLDEDHGTDLENIASISAGHKDCTTYFTCCSSFEKNSYKIENLVKSGFDVQSHGYYHHTYSDKRQNDKNIDRSLEYFRRFNYPIKGFAAPKGIWNEGLQASLEERSFLYSSEFAFDYDNFPRYPFLNGRFSEVLQIPIHPVCWGLYAAAGIKDDSAIKEYMLNVIMKKYEYNLPVMIYGHPGENISRDTRLLEDIYERVDSLKGIWRARFSDIALWWKKRSEIDFKDFDFDEEKNVLRYKIEGASDISGVSLSIETAGGKRALCAITGREGVIDLKSLNYETFNNTDSMPEIYGSRSWNMPSIKRFKECVARAIDWEKNTPVDELRRDTVASGIKYILRRLV